jgi:hypothetical protein
MILQVKLNNPNFCDGCCCFNGCYCYYYSEMMKELSEEAFTIRPEKCKRENSI